MKTLLRVAELISSCWMLVQGGRPHPISGGRPRPTTGGGLDHSLKRSRNGKTRVLLVDDHPMVRQTLRELITLEGDIAVCGEAEDRDGALAAVAESKPDLAIVDLRLRDSDGLELIRDIRQRHPETLTLVLSMYDESVYAEQAMLAGASGYISKLDATTKLMSTVRRVLCVG